MNRFFVFAALVVMLVFAVSVSAYAQPWVAQKEIDVRINVPATQFFEETETVRVSVDAGNNGTIEVSDVGLTRLRSNVDWSLSVGYSGLSGYDVYVKPSGSSQAWQPMNGIGTSFDGGRGAHDLTWDIQLVPTNPPNHSQTLTLNFTIGQR